MLYIGILLGWYLLGIIVALITVAIHLIMAERNGYKALDFWSDEGMLNLLYFILSGKERTERSPMSKLTDIIVWLVWPHFIVWMNSELFPTVYLLYDKKQPEYEPEEGI